MRKCTTFAAALALAFCLLPLSTAAAQLGRAWLIGDAGLALAGGGSYSGNAGFFGDAGLGVALSDIFGVTAEAGGLFTPKRDCSTIILGQCGRGFPRTTGVSLGIIENDNGIGVMHTSAFLAGIGAYRTQSLTGKETTTGGLYFGGEGAVVGNSHVALSVSGRVIILPRVSKQLLFIFPLTAGIRFW